jgi:demethoxyubiquinone hydroxylase (CLK1/Coq7/Cat5 family)
MKVDETAHARMALNHGATELPFAAKGGMKIASKVMTSTAYWL